MKYKVTKSKEEETVIPDGFYLGKQMYGSIYVSINFTTYKIAYPDGDSIYSVAVIVKNGEIEIKRFDNE